MFSHLAVGSDNIETSKKFYDATLACLGHDEGVILSESRCIYKTPTGLLILTNPINGESTTHGNGMTIGLRATSREMVDAWHKAGLENGGTLCEEPPGIRQGPGIELYLAYLRDPDGNKLCATYMMP
ncbi:VOC family protein [Vibrio sp. SS-MA-C1-2]|uniref:VOC family protein n=1 Tax=Vibrio sp. SS-MA-C1-2 TaxID=2908646 RepID=UPI001F2426BB|nr:VOC family protein [Vibrio sp. SS-MA-C1-2]UJF17595.1 VOC family protein [Vibrio sp. SS-MA-C1-2]